MIQRKILKRTARKTGGLYEEALYSFSPEIIVDALFGTGLGRPLSGDAALITETVNAYREETGCRVAELTSRRESPPEDGRSDGLRGPMRSHSHFRLL